MTSPYSESVSIPPDFTQFPLWVTQESILERFDGMVTRLPDKSAVCDHVKELSYSSLQNQVRAVARVIRERIGNSHTPKGVGLIFEPGVESVVAIMGVLASGNFFCPISPNDPPLRIRSFLEDAEINLILTTRQAVSKTLQSYLQSYDFLFVEDIAQNPAHAISPSIHIDPYQLAAVLYTSGSTGAPKGVCHTHHSLLHMVMDKGNEMGISPSDRIAGLSTFAFGGYYSNIFLAILFGATLYLYDIYRFRFEELQNWLLTRRISYFHCTPTTLRQFLDTLKKPTNFPALRLVTLGGETVYARDVHRFQNLVVNAVELGTTGATIETYYYASVFFNRPFPTGVDQLPMGFPSSRACVDIRDESGAVLQPGQTGEITVISDSVSPGYWKQAALNEEKFKTDENQKRYFRLGDLGTFTPEGLLYHKGRTDFQIKIRGIRVELGEIEAAFYKHPDVKDAVVISHSDADGEAILVAYITTTNNATIHLDGIYDLLGMYLPPHQIPTRIVFLDSFPLTRTHKIDRTSLPDPNKISRTIDSKSVVPRTEFERRIHDIWVEVLGHEQFGVKDHFITSGGDSLRAMRVLNRIEKEFHTSLPMGEFMTAGTIDILAGLVQRHVSE